VLRRSYLRATGRIRPPLIQLRRAVRPHAEWFLFIFGGVVTGILLSVVVSILDFDDRIVVGNTGGTLSSLIEVDQERILIGAGPSRSHAADLIGRTTRPWDREVDLLILPGWDDHHVAGAIGLIERRAVHAIAVVGLPGEEVSWTILEREARDHDVPITFISRPSTLDLSGNSELVVTLADDDGGSWIRLIHKGKQIDFIDSDSPERSAPDRSVLSTKSDHILVNLRGFREPHQTHPIVLVSPSPHWQYDFEEIQASFHVAVDRNEHVEITAHPRQIRVPMSMVEKRDDR
jgi:hypothetical protein